jgi:dTDP-glucose 4,6-dehydratase
LLTTEVRGCRRDPLPPARIIPFILVSYSSKSDLAHLLSTLEYITLVRYFITGGAGFIGSNFVNFILSNHSDEVDTVTVFDSLTYAANLKNLHPHLESTRLRFVKGDVRNFPEVLSAMKGADVVLHFAAESHVDRSIHASDIFIETNVLGTRNVLEAARITMPKLMINISTDEVYGSVVAGSSEESDILLPNSPYSASKASSDLVCRSYVETYGLSVITTRSCNNFGPRQFPEKLIPLLISKLLKGENLPIYGDGKNIREWIHVEDNCKAIKLLVDSGKIGEIYNIGSGVEKSNMEIATALLLISGNQTSRVELIEDRPGHDFRYSLNTSKLYDLGFTCSKLFEDSLAETFEWYTSKI